MDIIERIELLLFETFDTGKKLKIKVHSNKPDWIEYEFSIDGKEYNFHASSEFDEHFGEVWNVEFANMSSGYGYHERYGLTGTGSPMKVFSAVARCFEILLKTKKPNIFYFTADVKSRRKLYDRFVKMITQKYPYRLSNNDYLMDYIGQDEDKIYAFERK